MKNIYLKSGKTQDVFNELKYSFSGKLTSKKNEYNLALGSNFAKGHIKGKTLPNGMTYMQFDMCFYDDVRLSMESFMTSPIFFIYCSQGNIQHSFGVQGDKKNIKKEQTGILKSASSINTIFYFQKNVPTTFCVIAVETSEIGDQQNAVLTKKIKNSFLKVKEDYLTISFQNFNVMEKMEELNTMPQNGIVRDLLISRILENILEMEVENQMDGFDKISQNVNFFVNKHLDEIKKVPNFFRNTASDFEARFLIQSPKLVSHKINEGFKLTYNRVLHDLLIFMKIERQRI